MHDLLYFVAGIGFTVFGVVGIPLTFSAVRNASLNRRLRRAPQVIREQGDAMQAMLRVLSVPGDPRPDTRPGPLPAAPQKAATGPQTLDDGLTDAGLPHRRSQWPCSQWEARTAHTAHTWQDPIVGTVRCPGIKP